MAAAVVGRDEEVAVVDAEDAAVGASGRGRRHATTWPTFAVDWRSAAMTDERGEGRGKVGVGRWVRAFYL